MDDLGLNGRKMRSFCGNRWNVVGFGIEWMKIWKSGVGWLTITLGLVDLEYIWLSRVWFPWIMHMKYSYCTLQVKAMVLEHLSPQTSKTDSTNKVPLKINPPVTKTINPTTFRHPISLHIKISTRKNLFLISTKCFFHFTYNSIKMHWKEVKMINAFACSTFTQHFISSWFIVHLFLLSELLKIIAILTALLITFFSPSFQFAHLFAIFIERLYEMRLLRIYRWGLRVERVWG